MTKPTIHFVYSVPRSGNIIRRAIDKAILKTKIFPPLYRTANNFFIPWRKPIRAPHSITYNLLKEFKKYGRVRFYSLYEHTVIKLKPDDYLIGVPAQNLKDLPWKEPNKQSVLYRTLEKYPDHKKSFIIMPYSNDPLFVGWANQIIEKHGKNLLLLSGKIWFNNWQNSPWKNFVIGRKARVEMGINPADYPLVKKEFNPKGKRGFLYVGHTSWYKNTKELEKIAAAMPQVKFGHVGLGKIKGFEQIADYADLDEKFMSEIIKKYDVFINVSWDAQVTTVLEQMCFGLPVACTPESGYDFPTLVQLKIDDTTFNVNQLTRIQNMDESELKEIAVRNRELVIQNNSWQQFTKTVIDFMGLKQQ